MAKIVLVLFLHYFYFNKRYIICLYIGDSITPQWVAAWKRIATVVRSVSNVKVYTTWNPCVSSYSPFEIVNTTYPGDEYVDVIGLDIYSVVWPGSLYDWQLNNGTIDANVSIWCQSSVNREHYWNYPGANQWVPNSLSGSVIFSHFLYFFIHIYQDGEWSCTFNLQKKEINQLHSVNQE